MPDSDFDARKPPGAGEPNKPRTTLIANRLRTLLIATKPRTLLIGGVVFLYVVVAVPLALQYSSFSWPGGLLLQELLGEAPNGKIAFLGVGAGYGDDIYVMNADGSGETRLTNSSAHEFSPVWSPDGEKIAFTREKVSLKLDAAIYDIYVMNADGTGRTRLTDTIESEEIPTWSPDGEKIAFWASGELGDPGAAICVINAVDGTGRRCLAEDVIPGQLERDIEWGRD
jgi:WD40 repeat protein